MNIRSNSSGLPKIVIGIGILAVLQGCGTTTKSTLLRSELTASPPIGLVRLPTTKDGVSFQGSISLQANQYTSRPLGTPDLKKEMADLNRPIEITLDSDSSKIDGAVHLTQDQWMVSGEGSVFFSKNFRLFLGIDGSSSNAFWAGVGFNAGKEWSFEVDASMGTLISNRQEEWRIETTSGHSSAKTRDTSFRRKDSLDFTRLDFTFAKRAGGPIIGYQALNMPITKAPNGDEYSRWLHTITAGYSKSIGFGTLAGFVQATNTGEAWSPCARVQYSFAMGGETSEED